MDIKELRAVVTTRVRTSAPNEDGLDRAVHMADRGLRPSAVVSGATTSGVGRGKVERTEVNASIVKVAKKGQRCLMKNQCKDVVPEQANR